MSERLAELVENGDVTPVRVEGWRHPAYVAAGAGRPRQGSAATLLSPFDNLIWARDRAERLFGTRIRLEIYTPAHRREHGYYVLPFLLRDAIVARVDLKADRTAGMLRVKAAHAEAHADPLPTAEALAEGLRHMARWLGLAGVDVAERGDLATAVAKALA